jgi:uncharacterized protein
MIENNDFSYKFDELKCMSCDGNCCIGESGYIWISNDEIVNLATFFSISKEEVIKKYLYKVKYKYSIKEKQLAKNNFACIFFDLEKKQCSIYDVRPKQCKTFPFWNYFKNRVDEVKQECPAIVD